MFITLGRESSFDTRSVSQTQYYTYILYRLYIGTSETQICECIHFAAFSCIHDHQTTFISTIPSSVFGQVTPAAFDTKVGQPTLRQVNAEVGKHLWFWQSAVVS